MGEPEIPLVEIRLFKLRPGVCAEFHRISRDGTVPLMRECGITVLAHGPSLNAPDSYYLVRRFASEQDRVARSQSVYARPEWDANYDAPVMDMIDDYHTIVMPATAAIVDAISAGA